MLILQGYTKGLVEETFSSHVEFVLREPILFGDYRNTLTGEPRVYEDVVDYEAVKAVFEEVRGALDVVFRAVKGVFEEVRRALEVVFRTVKGVFEEVKGALEVVFRAVKAVFEEVRGAL